MTDCYRCGSSNHLYRDCTAEAPAAAPIGAAGLLKDTCPMCGTPPGTTCYNLTTRNRMYDNAGTPVTHPARHEPIWHTPEVAARRRELRQNYPGLYNMLVANNGRLSVITGRYLIRIDLLVSHGRRPAGQRR